VEDDPTGGKFAGAATLLNGAAHKLDDIINFHVGDLVTALQRGTLQPGGQEALVYATIMGGVGARPPRVGSASASRAGGALRAGGGRWPAREQHTHKQFSWAAPAALRRASAVACRWARLCKYATARAALVQLIPDALPRSSWVGRGAPACPAAAHLASWPRRVPDPKFPVHVQFQDQRAQPGQAAQARHQAGHVCGCEVVPRVIDA